MRVMGCRKIRGRCVEAKEKHGGMVRGKGEMTIRLITLNVMYSCRSVHLLCVITVLNYWIRRASIRDEKKAYPM